MRKPAKWGLAAALATAAALVAVAAAVARGAADPLPPAGEPVAPGTYLGPIVRPPFTFRIRQQGWLLQAVTPRLFILLRERLTQGVTFTNPARLSGVINPRSVVDSRRPPGVAVVRMPRDLFGWLRRHPRLRAGRPATVRIGNVRATRLDVTVRRGYPVSGCPTRCVGIFPASTPSQPGLWFQVQGSTTRYLLIRNGGKRVLVIIEAPAARFRTFLRSAIPLVASIRFR
jgi:hypothetical protein